MFLQRMIFVELFKVLLFSRALLILIFTLLSFKATLFTKNYQTPAIKTYMLLYIHEHEVIATCMILIFKVKISVKSLL